MNIKENAYDYIPTVDEAFVKRERAKARDLRRGSWWAQQIGRGVCHHCGEKFARDHLSMDHLLALSRGGRSTKKNIVVACKQCNSHKKNLTIAELRLRDLG